MAELHFTLTYSGGEPKTVFRDEFLDVQNQVLGESKDQPCTLFDGHLPDGTSVHGCATLNSD